MIPNSHYGNKCCLNNITNYNFIYMNPNALQKILPQILEPQYTSNKLEKRTIVELITNGNSLYIGKNE